jgi:hypothetical protein
VTAAKALREACREPGPLSLQQLVAAGRSVKDTLEIAGRLERAGADLVSLSERIDTTTTAGRTVFRMQAILAGFERDLCSVRTTWALSREVSGELGVFDVAGREPSLRSSGNCANVASCSSTQGAEWPGCCDGDTHFEVPRVSPRVRNA